MRERRPAPAAPARCKLVLVGDVQCGKTAMLQVLAKDCYPETYVPTVFENYTACSPYYDNVRPLCYSDSDAVLLCFDVSRPETLDSAAKKVRRGLSLQDSVPVGGVPVRFGGLTDTGTLTPWALGGSEMWGHRPRGVPVGVGVCRNRGTTIWGHPCRVWTAQRHCPRRSLWSLGAQGCKDTPPRSPPRSLSKRLLHLPSRSELISSTFKKEKAKSCSVM
ncbi:RND1 protein, partial [Gymnorhina tibicen]|nr:RND1 protein [Gymnorhina tibicen]